MGRVQQSFRVEEVNQDDQGSERPRNDRREGEGFEPAEGHLWLRLTSVHVRKNLYRKKKQTLVLTQDEEIDCVLTS